MGGKGILRVGKTQAAGLYSEGYIPIWGKKRHRPKEGESTCHHVLGENPGGPLTFLKKGKFEQREKGFNNTPICWGEKNIKNLQLLGESCPGGMKRDEYFLRGTLHFTKKYARKGKRVNWVIN